MATLIKFNYRSTTNLIGNAISTTTTLNFNVQALKDVLYFVRDKPRLFMLIRFY